MVEYKKTSYSEGFGIFNRIHKEDLDSVNNNVLNLYMLNTENKLFNYDQLYEYLLQNICQYVFDRRKINETQNELMAAKCFLAQAVFDFSTPLNSSSKFSIFPLVLFAFIKTLS